MAEVKPESIDWSAGLPKDVLELVVEMGGLKELKAMRAVSKTWKQGFEGRVTKVKKAGPSQQKTPTMPVGSTDNKMDVDSAGQPSILPNVKDLSLS